MEGRGFDAGLVTPQGRALRPFIRQFKLPRGAFEDLDRRRRDGYHPHALSGRLRICIKYCLHVASAVGLVCVEIFGYRDPASRTYASELGVALQLTNILRDVSTDFARGRLYLPLEDLERFRVSEDDLKRGVREQRRGRAVDSRAGSARAPGEPRAAVLRSRRDAARPREDAGRLVVAAEIMGGIYRGILDRIERRNYDVFTKPIRVPRPTRAWIAARTWAQAGARRIEHRARHFDVIVIGAGLRASARRRRSRSGRPRARPRGAAAARRPGNRVSRSRDRGARRQRPARSLRLLPRYVSLSRSYRRRRRTYGSRRRSRCRS